jgi:hypothetical protein
MPHAARRPWSWLIFDVSQKMKAIYIIGPVLLTAGFAAYAFWYSNEKAEAESRILEDAARGREQSIDAIFSGKTFLGRDGRKEAQSDIGGGAAKFFLYGKTRSDIAYFSTILKERFGVMVDPLAGCIVSEPLVAFADAYNAEVRQFIAGKFGPTALDEADREASDRWKANHDKG